jgi:DNA repair protein RecN (Recombination protein N)
MLKNLYIKNYVLIEELNFVPSKTFSTITGETGAGKSIILGALGLITGNRADTQVLLNKENKCTIEVIFDLKNYQLKELFLKNDIDYEEECIIRREISPSGKSRAFVNDIPVTLNVLREITEFLIDIHSRNIQSS